MNDLLRELLSDADFAVAVLSAARESHVACSGHVPTIKRVGRDLVRNYQLSAQVFHEVQQELGERGVIEVIAAIG